MATLREAYSEFVVSCQASGLAASTIAHYGWSLEPMLQAFGDELPLHQVDRPKMRRYVVELRSRVKPSSVRSYLIALSRFWNWCSDEFGVMNPMTGIKQPRQRLTPKPADPAAFVAVFLAAGDSRMPERNRAMLAMLADTGVRRSGLVSIRLADVDRVHRRTWISEKSGAARRVYWTHYTQALLDCWWSVHPGGDYLFCDVAGRQLKPNGVYQLLKRLKERAGVSGRVNPHSFRHAFAREYLMHGGDVVTLARLLGHKDVNLTAAYYAIFTEDELGRLQEARSPLISLLEAQNGPKSPELLWPKRS